MFRRCLSVSSAFCLLAVGPTYADFKPEEPHLYAGGFPTADTLRRHEWVLAAPFGGWLGYGLTDRWSAVWDFPAAFAGVASLMTRFQLPHEGPDRAYAVEFYGTFYSKRFTDERADDYRVDHLGTQAWVHLIRTGRLSETWRWHVYAGANYKNYQLYRPYNKGFFPETLYRRHVNPDVGVGLEWRAKPWMELHLSGMYGNTFIYDDLTAIKSMEIFSALFAPFGEKRLAILRNLRLEFNLYTVNVPDGHFSGFRAISLIPYIYWQWGGPQ